MDIEPADDKKLRKAKDTAQLVYILQAASFFVGLTFIAAVVINYIKRDELEGTWLESHNRWQMRTFWFSLLWSVIGFITLIVFIGWFIWLANAIWVIYRIVRGWINLSEEREMYQN